MEKNLCKNMGKNKGITLIALVITIIVLLILAGVSLSMVLNQDGIFSRAEKSVNKYNQTKARETLELALSDAQIQKYTTGLTDEELDNKIAEIEGELLPKEKPNKNLQNVIVDGHIFEIDRSVPKIVDYIGPAYGVIITAIITGNDGWVKPSETVSLSGVIKTYSGGTITNSTATVIKGSTTITGFPTTGGNYTISNISEDTDIKITANDSNGKKAEKTINIIIKRDGTAPTVETLTAEAEGLKIKFSAAGHDKDASGQEGSGIHHFNYTISSTQDTSLEGIPTDKRTGTFALGQTVEIDTTPTENREETTYTIKVTATDNCGNITSNTNAKASNVIAIDGLTLQQAKKLVNENTLQQYIGRRIIDYNPEAEGTWRIFYYDADGYFGIEKALYLKGISEARTIPTSSPSNEGIAMMKKMNPELENSGYLKVELDYEKQITWLCDPENWKRYKTEYAEFAIGSASVEMFIRSYNVWKQNNPNGNALICKIFNSKGYGVGSRFFLSNTESRRKY